MIAIEKERGRQSWHSSIFPLFWCCWVFMPSLCMWGLFSVWLLKTLFFFLSYSGFYVFLKNWKWGPKSRSMAVVSWDSSRDLRTAHCCTLPKRNLQWLFFFTKITLYQLTCGAHSTWCAIVLSNMVYFLCYCHTLFLYILKVFTCKNSCIFLKIHSDEVNFLYMLCQ